MRKYISLLFIFSLFITYGCQDELEEDFINPEVYSPTDNVPASMFSEMMSRTRTFKNDYGEFWWQLDAGGAIEHLHLNKRHLRDAYSWFADANDVNYFYATVALDAYYYGHNNDFREIPLMQGLINDMSEEKKADNEIYLTISNMVREYRASKAVDMYNSVPYSEGLQGGDGVFFPKFDDPMTIYKSIIDNLGIYADLVIQNASQLSTDGKAIFEGQDIIFEGDAEKWQQFANAVRLRLAVRISGVQPEYAKTVIGEILADNNLPTEDLLIPVQMWVSHERKHWKFGLVERDYASFISPTLMYKMDKNKDHEYTAGVDDPRMPVLFLPNRDSLYMPVSYDFSVGQAIYNAVRESNIDKYGFGGAYTVQNQYRDIDPYMKYNAYSSWNPATMVNNAEPWRAFTLAEVDLLLAEVNLKALGTTPKSAAEYVNDAVVHSIDYWYYANSFSTWDQVDESNRYFLMPTMPDQAVKDQFATVISDEYNAASNLEDKMEVIIGQKYVHLNLHDYFEVSNEMRRTKHPKLPLIKFNSSMAIAPHLERYPYPSNVPATNGESYNEVSAQDNFTTPIFWVPENMQNVSYYMDEYDSDYLYTKFPGVPESFPPE